MKQIFIKPAIDKKTGKAYKVRLPGKPHMFLPENGAKVELNKYWRRRLNDGSVIDPKAEAEKAKKAEQEAAEKAAAAKTSTKE